MPAMVQAFQRITTERLLLRAVRDSDLDAVFALHADPETNRFSVSGPMRSQEEAHRQLTLWLDDWSRHGVGYWVVERREAPGDVVGFGGVRHKVLEGRPVLNLAYRFTPRTWGTGYATEMARTALALAQRHLPDVPVVAIIHPDNEASLRVAERSGMRFERVIDYAGTPSRLYVPAPP
ncbi:GNAT family N-acetyltransferase [Myxococcus xanthus]|uniref:GNAT family N-acetyltransferase n=1 Tax=Myxococcus xanthus TaxID=34 RepID=UPI00112DC9CC